jgi:hypothetical protein
MRKYMSIVDQEDHICPFLSARESLDFAARFYVRGRDERASRVETVIKKLGLESCQHTRCGNAFFKVSLVSQVVTVPAESTLVIQLLSSISDLRRVCPNLGRHTHCPHGVTTLDNKLTIIVTILVLNQL